MLGKKDGKPTSEKKSRSAKVGVPSVLGDDLNILGNLISDGYIDINGHIEGNVKCDSLTIRENGNVRGDVVANVVHIHGEVNGIIKAKSVNLASTARVKGVIIHETMSMQDGAFIDGQCKRSERHHVIENAKEAAEPKLELIENVRVLTSAK